jgi:ParB family chromosome partitioning protein
MTARKIPLAKIDADPRQPRKQFDETALIELAESIKENGLIQSITVRPGKRGRFIVIAGERRFRAHKILAARGLRRFASIEANVRQDKGASLLVKQIVENLSRENLTPLEEARAFHELRETFGMDETAIATKLGLAPFRVRWRLQLLNLSPAIVKMAECGQIDRQQTLELARLDNPRDQTRVLQMINRGQVQGWKALRNAVDAVLGDSTAMDLFGEDAPKATAADVHVVTAMEQRIQDISRMVSGGWKDGACVIASKVNPDRANEMASRLAAIKTSISHMERELRNVAAQASIAISRGAA